MFSFRRAATMIEPERALPGSDEPVLKGTVKHVIFDTPIEPPPAGSELAYFGMGCFWGAEKLFWGLDGVTSTAVGYQGGYSPNPTYDEVCSGRTGHTEAVRVAFDPEKVSYADLLKVFFENHDPTQGLRQGNDVGSQYRSAIYTASAEQAETVEKTRKDFQQALNAKGYGEISTEIATSGTFYLAEAYHQQYLAKNPSGYCPIHATGVTCN